MRRFRLASCLLLVGMTAPDVLPAAARSLGWSALEVDARLDAEGELHVTERHAMVFTGDWNGGMRQFQLGSGTDLDLHRVLRVDPASGETRELARGDLDRVDHFDWTEGDTLRWRSRLASDPEFDGEAITYVLDYTLSGILFYRRGSYLLDHDFAFRERAGTIERFTLRLELDPAWRPETPLPDRVEHEDLRPGSSVPLRAELAYVGEGRPGAVLAALPLGWRLLFFAPVPLALAALWLRFRRHEAARGRYAEIDVPERPDRGWLEEHLFDLRPEVVGALWDRRIGPPEVAAVLARLVAEGKLRSSVEERRHWLFKRRVLGLELLVDREELESYDRELVEALFFEGRTETDLDAVREHYKKSGFQPTAVIKLHLEDRLEKVVGPKAGRPKNPWPWRLFGAIVALLAVDLVVRGESAMVMAAFLGMATPWPILLGLILAFRYRAWNRGLRAAGGMLLVPVLLALALSLFAAFPDEILRIVTPDFLPGAAGILILALCPVATASLIFQLARTLDSRAVVLRRRQLAEIRRRFVGELERPEPDLEDGWFPYLLAFGLDRQVDGWFRSFGGASTRVGSAASFGGSAASSMGSSPSSSSSSSGWTGGGGAFGGAGASAGWAAAAAGLAAGVSAPSSSGGSSGGGGSFSGGGGGGGW